MNYIDYQKSLSIKYLDNARHPDAVGGERELEVERGVAAALLAVVAAPAADLLAEDDVVVVEEDVAALALVAVEEHDLAGRRQHGAFAPAAVLCRGDLRAGIEMD